MREPLGGPDLVADYPALSSAASALTGASTQIEAIISALRPVMAPDSGDGKLNDDIDAYMADVLAHLGTFGGGLHNLGAACSDAVAQLSAHDNDLAAAAREAPGR